MAKHSHWAQIKHKKAQIDAKRSQLMGKLIRLISLCAREGSDPETNPKLRLAIERAREFQVPLESIEKAIKKSKLKENNLEEIIYEAYLDEVQLIIKTITDNKNRTLSEIKHILNKNNARLGEPGSVIWNFQEQGVAVISKEYENKVLDILDFYQDIKETDGYILLITSGENFSKLQEALQEKSIIIKNVYFELKPLNSIEIDKTKKEKLVFLVSQLLELDDVEEIFTNVSYET